MNLYVWNHPYDVRYGASILYVVAHDEATARQKALDATHSTYGDPEAKTMRLDGLGPPDRVVPINDGYAEVYEWQE